jgi:hypothetical protein
VKHHLFYFSRVEIRAQYFHPPARLSFYLTMISEVLSFSVHLHWSKEREITRPKVHAVK